MKKVLNINGNNSQLLEYLQDRHPKIRFFRFENGGHGATEHVHHYFQLTYIFSGKGTVHNHPYEIPMEPNCMYMFNPHELHALDPKPEVECINVTCRFELNGFQGHLLRPMIRMDEHNAADCEALLRKIQAETTVGEPENLIRANLLLTELLLLLNILCLKEENDKISSLVADSIDYINKNFCSGIGVEDIARTMNVSSSHLCRAFRRDTGNTPLSYLRRVRLGYATERLFSTRMKIGDIASEAGFETPKNMNMAIQRVYNMSATEFRRHHLENNPIEN